VIGHVCRIAPITVHNKMVMVDVDGSSLPIGSQSVIWLGLMVGSHLALSLHSTG